MFDVGRLALPSLDLTWMAPTKLIIVMQGMLCIIVATVLEISPASSFLRVFMIKIQDSRFKRTNYSVQFFALSWVLIPVSPSTYKDTPKIAF